MVGLERRYHFVKLCSDGTVRANPDFFITGQNRHLDLVFLGLPHGASQSMVPDLRGSVKHVVDLAADFRLDDPGLYPIWYGEAHAAPGLLDDFVFGLPDLLAPRNKRFLVKTLAVLPEHRRGGTGAWLVGELHAVADRMGFTHGIHALMWQGSRSRNISQHGGRVFREYALYMKAL